MNLLVAKGSMMREYEGDFSFFNFLEWICLAIEDTTTRVPKPPRNFRAIQVKLRN